MAFPWQVIRKAELGTGNIVEDMKLGVDLALAGYPANFCPEARFESDEAPTLQAAATRRTRWEHGHVFTLLTQAPRLLLAGCRKLRPRLWALALELAVPPLSLLFLALCLLMAICVAWWQAGGNALPVIILGTSGLLGMGTILAAWAVFGRQLLSLKILCLLPVYVLWKLPIYLKLLIAPQRNWVRTERTPAS
jgi:cellulose synthase/poly-beta-1,6-N-acetylglucosamine synthase-like glycosyltransferase